MKNIIILLIAIYIYGCASPYAKSFAFGGYTESQYKQNVFEVMFDGNGFTSFKRASDLCLLRCAELCKLNGYKYFVIIEGSNMVAYSQYTMPTHTSTTGSATIVGNTIYGSSQSRTTGGETIIFAKPIIKNSIVCSNEEPVEVYSFEADFIIKSITSKYNIKLKPLGKVN